MLLSFLAGATWRPEPKRPDDARRLATWLDSHPADWTGAASLTEAAMDSNLPSRFELWRAAHEDAELLAPRRDTARTSFIRSGFFHWYELDDRQKKAVLDDAMPLLRDPQNFRVMAPAIWRLTRDFSFLRRASGNNYVSAAILRDIAATNGLFAEYRTLRDESMRQRESELIAKMHDNETLDPTEYVPSDCTTDDQPLLQAVLDYEHDHPIDKHPDDSAGAEHLIDYAIRHNLQPLDGIEFLSRDTSSVEPPFRARLAIAAGDVKRANLVEIGAGADDTPQWSDYYAERATYEQAHGDHDLALAYAHRASVARKQRLDWNGRCGETICTSARREIVLDQPRMTYSITLASASADDVPPYVEIYVDEARVGEGPLAAEQTFTPPPLAAGEHRIVVRVMNPFTRNLGQRKARIVRETLI
jgi:hypothetical protein